MAKLVKVGVQVPDTYPENSPVEIVYPSAYYAQARAAGGMVEGKLGAASGGYRPVLAKAGGDLLVYGGEVGDPLPPLVEIRVKPRGAGVRGVQWEHSGHPRDTGGGAWDGSKYGALPDEVMATAGQVQSLSTLLATGEQQQAQTAQALAVVAEAAVQAVDLGTQALEQAGSTPYPDDAAMQAAKNTHQNGDYAYRLDNRTKYQLRAGEWVPVGEGAASAQEVQAQAARLQFADLQTLTAATGLQAGQTVIVQDGARGGTFVVGSIGTHDNTITYAIAGGLFAHRVWDASVIQARWAGVSPDATAAANSAAMQQALDTANARGARGVEIGAGTFAWASRVKTYPHMHVYGQGESSTILRATVDTSFFYLDPKISGQSGYFGVAFTDFRMEKHFFPSTTWELDLPDCIRVKLTRVMTNSWQDSANRASTSGFRLQATPGVESYMATVTDCWANGGSLWIEQSDSRIQGGYYWAHNREFAIRIKNTAAVSVSNCDVVASPVHGGIWGDQSYGITVDDDVRFDGSYDGISSGWGINLEGGHSHNVGGDFYQSIYGSIKFNNVSSSLIRPATHREGNRINDPAYTGPAVDGMQYSYPDIFLEDSSGNEVHVGTHIISKARNRANGGGAAQAVRESGTSNNNTYIGGKISGTYQAPEIALSGAGSKIVGGGTGLNGRSLGMASGVATFATGGNKYLVVQHGLGVLPKRENVALTPQGDFGATNYWLDNLDATNLVLYVSAVPTTELKLAWRVTLD